MDRTGVKACAAMSPIRQSGSEQADAFDEYRKWLHARSQPSCHWLTGPPEDQAAIGAAKPEGIAKRAGYRLVAVVHQVIQG